MNDDLPTNAHDIFVEWSTKEGGIGVIAFTDQLSLPYIGIYGLNRIGRPNGLPCWLQRKTLLSDMMIGFQKETPLVISVDIEVSSRGLSLFILGSYPTPRFKRHTFALWNSERPRYGFTVL